MDGKNGHISRMLFSELYKIMVNKDTFVDFRGAIAPSLDSPLLPMHQHKTIRISKFQAVHTVGLNVDLSKRTRHKQ